MKLVLRLFMVILSAAFLVACEADGNTSYDGAVKKVGGVYYVLNSGDWNSNNSSLTRYDGVNGKVEQFFFEAQNGRMLGNTANDIVVSGSKMYIVVAGESTIEVTDLNAKSIKQIECEAQPRYMAVHGGNVYVSYYNGYVARLDTVTLNVEDKVKSEIT